MELRAVSDDPPCYLLSLDADTAILLDCPLSDGLTAVAATAGVLATGMAAVDWRHRMVNAAAVLVTDQCGEPA
jgi:hypothetical protein